MVEDQDKWPEAVFTRRDGALTHAIEQACLFGCIAILMVSALAIAVIPVSWMQSETLTDITDAVRGFWPKLDHDVALLQAEDPARGLKYAAFAAYCGAVTLLFSIAVAPLTWWAIGRSSVRLTYPQSGAFRKIPAALAVLVIWIFFETMSFDGDTGMGRALTRSAGLWFWTALLWGALAMFWGGAVIVAAKLWRHGMPESTDEYDQRMYGPRTSDFSSIRCDRGRGRE